MDISHYVHLHKMYVKLLRSSYRCLSINRNTRGLCVLGIETSCDDTGIAIVNSEGRVLANVLDSQQKIHTRYGGIIPPRAQDLHRSRIENVFERCILQLNDSAVKSMTDVDAIAVTTRPGLPLSLLVGLRFAKHLARRWNKPLVPIHHMEAHALQARMEQPIPYPFLCLLISGGHCQITFVLNANEFLLLGESLDDAPGEAFDKIARRLRLFVLPQYRDWNGGRAIEHAAKYATNADAYQFPLPLAHKRDCNFSFAGIKNNSFRTINIVEQNEGTPPDGLISNYQDFCAGLINASSRHLMHRMQRALEFCIAKNYFGQGPRSVVVSGGVANNDTIFDDIKRLAAHFDCATFRPSKKFCSDNGVMIAWDGIERILENRESSLRWDYDIEISGKAILGTSLQRDVAEAQLKCVWLKSARLKIPNVQ